MVHSINDKDEFVSIISTPIPNIVYFHNDFIPDCGEFQNIYDGLESRFPMLRFFTVDDMVSEIVSEANIRMVPCIRFYKYGMIIEEFVNRPSNELADFLEKVSQRAWM